jgi:hypothetical protein
LSGCGDFCLFCDGGGGGGGGGGQERTAEAGDVILADQFADNIFIYEYPSDTKRVLLPGFDDVSGLALYSSNEEEECDNPFAGLVAYRNGGNNLDTLDTFDQQAGQPDRLSLAVVPKGMSFTYGTDEIEADPGTIDLLFFTVNTEDTLYIYDLTGANVPAGFDNPFPITNGDLRLLFDSDFLQSPTALAINPDAGTATLFVLNDKEDESSVTRLSVNLTTWAPTSSQIIATMTEAGWRLFDIAYYDQADELFVSMKTEGQAGGAGRVLVIPQATTRTTPFTLASESTTAFVAQDYHITGLTAAPTDDQPGPASLLSLRANQLGQAEQFDIDQGGNPEDIFGFSTVSQFPEALAYDCTKERLLITDVPFNNDIDRTFFEAFPSQ